MIKEWTKHGKLVINYTGWSWFSNLLKKTCTSLTATVFGKAIFYFKLVKQNEERVGIYTGSWHHHYKPVACAQPVCRRSVREAVCTCPCTHIQNYVKVKLVASCIAWLKPKQSLNEYKICREVWCRDHKFHI